MNSIDLKNQPPRELSEVSRGWPFQIRSELPPFGAFTICEDFGDILIQEVLNSRPKTILEVGSGVSTVLLGYCLEILGEGHIYSIEHLPEYAQRTRSLTKNHRVDHYTTVIDASLIMREIQQEQWLWYDTSGLAEMQYDLVVVDGPPRRTGPLARYPILPLFDDSMSSNSVLLLDDALRKDEEAILLRWQEEFPQYTVKRFNTKKGAARLASNK